MDENLAIKVENLFKVYQLRQSRVNEEGELVTEHWALKEVSFEIKKGESVGIIGPNGSGKSTLLKILAGVTKPSSGKVQIRGKVASILDIGAGFHPELSGRENVYLNGQIHGFTKKEIESKFDEIVAFSGIEQFINEPVKNYSQGMYLRLAFSIMAHLDFDVYLFDEVFGVGDAEFSHKIQKKFKEIEKLNKTILLASHNFSELRNKSKYIFIEKGKVIEESINENILLDYLEDIKIANNHDIHTKSVSLLNPQLSPNIEGLTIKKVYFYQPNQEYFVSNQPFYLELEFEKENNAGFYDIAVLIQDMQDNIILSTTPILSNIKPMSIKGSYRYICEFPGSIFGFQAYSISVYINNAKEQNKSSEKNINYDNTLLSISKSATIYKNLLFFKVVLSMNDKKINLDNYQIAGGLLPVFKWDKEEIV